MVAIKRMANGFCGSGDYITASVVIDVENGVLGGIHKENIVMDQGFDPHIINFGRMI